MTECLRPGNNRCAGETKADDLIAPSSPIAEEDWQALLVHGGYPEPFLKRDRRFTRRWQRTRIGQLLREDIRDSTRIQQLDQLATLGRLLAARSGEQLVYSSLARAVRVSENTISPSLVYFHDQLGCEHSFQAIVTADYVDTDAFSYLGPVSIPFRTLFSQLL